MNEINAQDKLPPPKELSRRDFLQLFKLLPAVPLAAALPGSEPRTTETPDELIARSIENHLGLTPQDVSLTTRFSNHLITPAALAQIEKLQPTVIMGEINPEDISPATLTLFGELQRVMAERGLTKIPQSMADRLQRFIPGVGATPDELVYHLGKIKGWLDAGKPVVIPSDVSIEPIIQEPRDAKDYATMFWPVFAALVGVAALPQKGGLSRRDFLKQLGIGVAATGGALVVGGILKSFISFDPPDAVAQGVSRGVEGYASLTDFVSHPDPDNPWLSLLRAITHFRNNAMALNTWCAIAKRCAPSHPERLFFFAGTAHEGVKKLFIQGPQTCEHRDQQAAQELVTLGSELLLQKATTLPLAEGESLTKDQISDRQNDWVVNQLSLYADMFPEPPFFGPNENPLNTSKATYFPRTPQTIFLDALEAAMAHNAALPEKQRHALVLERLYQYRRSLLVKAALARTAKETYPYAEGKGLVGFQPSDQYISAIQKSFLTKDDLLVETQEEDDKIVAEYSRDTDALWPKFENRYSYNLPYELIDGKWFIGLTSFRGSYVPVFRSIDQSPDNSEEMIAHDYAIIAGIPVQFRQYQYRRVSRANDTAWNQTLQSLRQKAYSSLMMTNRTPKEVWRNSRFYQVMEVYSHTMDFWVLDVPNSDPDPLDVMVITGSTAGPFVRGTSIARKE